jgi:hypothetical protein
MKDTILEAQEIVGAIYDIAADRGIPDDRLVWQRDFSGPVQVALDRKTEECQRLREALEAVWPWVHQADMRKIVDAALAKNQAIISNLKFSVTLFGCNETLYLSGFQLSGGEVVITPPVYKLEDQELVKAALRELVEKL